MRISQEAPALSRLIWSVRISGPTVASNSANKAMSRVRSMGARAARQATGLMSRPMTADDGTPQLVRLPDRGPAAHEKVEDHRSREFHRARVEVHHRRPRRRSTAENHCPEHTAEALR